MDVFEAVQCEQILFLILQMELNVLLFIYSNNSMLKIDHLLDHQFHSNVLALSSYKIHRA